VQVKKIVGVIDELVDLLSYKDVAQEGGAA
jgi:hypothetical protein